MTIRRAAFTCLLLSLAGLLLAGYLSFLHLALLRGELVGGPLCGGAGSLFNCHAVAASRFSRIFGVPVAYWGVLGYLVLLTLSLVAWGFPELSRQALTAAAALAGVFLVLDAGLLWVMVVKIQALCSFCLGMYGIKGLILWTAKRGLGRRWTDLFRPMPTFWMEFRSPVALAAGWMIGTVAATGLAGILAVHFSSEYLSRTPEGLKARIVERMQTAPRTAVTGSDSPRQGRPEAPLQVVMFTDLLCPNCRQAAEFNAIALAAHGPRMSLVIRQFPLDTFCNAGISRMFHPGACRVAEAAACAQEQGKFWPLYNLLSHGKEPPDPARIEESAAGAGLDLDRFRACLASGRGKGAVMRDIEEARRLGVTGTPTFFVNGVKVVGALTPAQFDEISRVEENKAALASQGEKP